MPKRKCSSIDLSVGQRMKYYREQCNLTQQQVADVLNINRTTYTKYETGVSEPSNDLLGKICAIFGVDYNSILAGSDSLSAKLADSDDELKMNTLSSDERMIIADYRTLPPEEQKKIAEHVHNIVLERRKKFL